MNIVTRSMLSRGKHVSILSVPMGLLILYVLLLFTAQETLLPPRWHSFVMYMFILVTFIVGIGKRKLNFFVVNKYTIFYLILLLYSFVSTLWGVEMVLGALYVMMVALIITFCIVRTIDSNNKLDLCVRVFVCSGDVMGVMLLWTGQVFNAEERLGQSLTGNANSFSALLMVAAVFAAWLFIYKNNKADKVFNMLSLAFLLFLMGMSGGRKTIMAVVVCFIWFMLGKDNMKASTLCRNLFFVVLALVGIYFATMNIPILYETIGERFESLFVLFYGGTSDVTSDSVRKQMIFLAVEQWSYNPIWGYGLDTFKYFNQRTTGHFYYAHNNYAEILYDLGLIGFLIYYGFIFKLLLNLRKLNQEAKPYKMLGIGLILLVLVYDIGGVGYYTVLIQMIVCLIYLCYSLNAKING